MLGYYVKNWGVASELDPEELAALDEAIAESETEEQSGLPEITQQAMQAQTQH